MVSTHNVFSVNHYANRARGSQSTAQTHHATACSHRHRHTPHRPQRSAPHACQPHGQPRRASATPAARPPAHNVHDPAHGHKDTRDTDTRRRSYWHIAAFRFTIQQSGTVDEDCGISSHLAELASRGHHRGRTGSAHAQPLRSVLCESTTLHTSVRRAVQHPVIL